MSTYLLILQGQRPAAIQVGALGQVFVTPGWYLYVGSARRGLAARLRRHQRPGKRRHWHIDYLLADGLLTVQEIWTTAHRRECSLADSLLALPASAVVHRRLGASDCRCRAHFLKWRGSRSQLREILLSLGLTPFLAP